MKDSHQLFVVSDTIMMLDVLAATGALTWSTIWGHLSQLCLWGLQASVLWLGVIVFLEAFLPAHWDNVHVSKGKSRTSLTGAAAASARCADGGGDGSARGPAAASWWYVRGKAYDFTPWLDSHPGGRYILEVARGSDCTELFEMYHAASLQEPYISSQLGKYAVADSKEGGPPGLTFPWHEGTPFYDAAKRVVRAYRRVHGIKASDSWGTVLWYAVWCVLHYATLARWYFGLGGKMNAALLGVTVFYWAFDVLHCGTHYALTKDPATSHWLGWLGSWAFIVPATWIRQHVLGHHVHTNLDALDPDLYHFAKLNNIRPSEAEAGRVAPFAFVRFGTRLGAAFNGPFLTTIVPTLLHSYALLKSNMHPRGTVTHAVWAPNEKKSAWCGWIFLLGMLVSVIAAHGFVHAAIPFMVSGCIFYAFTQVSHINSPSLDVSTSKEWASQPTTLPMSPPFSKWRERS